MPRYHIILALSLKVFIIIMIIIIILVMGFRVQDFVSILDLNKSSAFTVQILTKE